MAAPLASRLRETPTALPHGPTAALQPTIPPKKAEPHSWERGTSRRPRQKRLAPEKLGSPDAGKALRRQRHNVAHYQRIAPFFVQGRRYAKLGRCGNGAI